MNEVENEVQMKNTSSKIKLYEDCVMSFIKWGKSQQKYLCKYECNLVLFAPEFALTLT